MTRNMMQQEVALVSVFQMKAPLNAIVPLEWEISEMSARRSKKIRCHKCRNCLKPNCGVCAPCRDMTRFGGTGTLRRACS